MSCFKFNSYIGLAAVLLLATSACSRKAVQVLLEPSVALGTVLAEEVIQTAGPKKEIAVISPDASWGPASTVETTFKSVLQSRGYTVVTARSANLGDPMHMSSVGLMASDFAEALEKSSSAGALVSFAGGPQFWQALGARLNAPHPPVFVVATAMLGNVPGLPTDHGQLQAMVNAGAVQVAIIDGAEALPAAAKTDELHSVFAQNFSQLRKTQ
jgi:hypothetical protein